MANLIDGKKISAEVKEKVRLETASLVEKHGIQPGLAVVIVGNDPASRVYVNNKKKACEAVGFRSWEYALPEDTTQAELLELVETAFSYSSPSRHRSMTRRSSMPSPRQKMWMPFIRRM